MSHPICTALSTCLSLSIRLKTCLAVSLQQDWRDCRVLKQKKALGLQALTKKFNYAHSKKNVEPLEAVSPRNSLLWKQIKVFQ